MDNTKKANSEFIEVKRTTKQKYTIYILAMSFDLNKGQQEQQIKSLLADTLKDILKMSKAEVFDKLNQGLTKIEGPTYYENSYQWKFQFKSQPKVIEKITKEGSIMMATARIYFYDNPDFKSSHLKKIQQQNSNNNHQNRKEPKPVDNNSNQIRSTSSNSSNNNNQQQSPSSKQNQSPINNNNNSSNNNNTHNNSNNNVIISEAEAKQQQQLLQQQLFQQQQQQLQQQLQQKAHEQALLNAKLKKEEEERKQLEYAWELECFFHSNNNNNSNDSESRSKVMQLNAKGSIDQVSQNKKLSWQHILQGFRLDKKVKWQYPLESEEINYQAVDFSKNNNRKIQITRSGVQQELEQQEEDIEKSRLRQQIEKIAKEVKRLEMENEVLRESKQMIQQSYSEVLEKIQNQSVLIQQLFEKE